MFTDAPFYHASIRKMIIGFGKLFTNLYIERKDEAGVVSQQIKVQVSPGNREKWLARIQEDPELKAKTQTILPRIGFEIAGFQYDPSRKMNTLNKFVGNLSSETGERSIAYAPVPYNINMNVYVVAKTQGDALQIVEQILPYFTPGYTMTILMFPEVGISQDIPVVLNGVEMEDNYDGSFLDKRMVTFILNFTIKSELIGPAPTGGNTILHTRVSLGDSRLERLHKWDVNDDGSITGGWEDIE